MSKTCGSCLFCNGKAAPECHARPPSVNNDGASWRPEVKFEDLACKDFEPIDTFKSSFDAPRQEGK